MKREISRRGFLRRGASLGTGLIISAQLPRPLAAAAAAASGEPEVFSPQEWRTVEAMTACIIPTDHEPGAVEANCVNFIDKALAREDAAALPLYRSGLAAADTEARERFGKTFVELETENRNALLGILEEGNTISWSPSATVPPQIFFENLRIHTLLAFLSDPKYGGNRNYSGWRVTGYPGAEHHLGGSSPEQVAGVEAVIPVWERAQHKH